MISTISPVEEERALLTENIKRLFQVIYIDQVKAKEQEETEDIPKIKVSSFLSKMSFYYEKIRNSVDYNEEHLLRRNAIERILKREIVIQGSLKKIKSREISRHLLTELIRAAYLPNNTIPEIKIDEIEIVIEKYIKLKDYALTSKEEYNPKNELVNWIISLAAGDIEERLSSSLIHDTIIKIAYGVLNGITDLEPNTLYKDDKEIQLYIGIQRKILKFDDAMVGFILFKYYNQGWRDAKEEDIALAAQKIYSIKDQINKQIDHPLKNQINKIANSYAVFFSVLKDVIKEDPKEAYIKIQKGFQAFSHSVKLMCSRKYKRGRLRLWRAALRSILYIFITKSVLVFFFEIPVSKWFGDTPDILALFINIIFPALLLLLVALFTRLPSGKNTNKIVSGIEEIMFKAERDKNYILRNPVQRSRLTNIMFGMIYIATFFASFGAVIWILNLINFNFISAIIFLFFLAFVSFLSIRIRKPILELRVLEAKENIFSFLIDFFYTPIIATGKWLSERFARINVFVFFLDFIIEAPFKTFVDIAEEWTKYVKERKEEIV